MSKLTEKHHYEGTLICVEGIDGSGKSTQLTLLRDWLKSTGKDVIFTEWNSSELISQTTKLAKKKNMLSPRTFSLLHAVDFADRLKQVIAPALKTGLLFLLTDMPIQPLQEMLQEVLTQIGKRSL